MALQPTRLTPQELGRICLDYLVQNPEQLADFMVQTGLAPNDLRRLVGTDGFAHGLIDYVVSNEPLLMAVAAAAQIRPESIAQTWDHLHRHEA